MEAQDICTPGKVVPVDNISRSRHPGPANFHRHQMRPILDRFAWRNSGSSAVVFPSIQGLLSARWRKRSDSVAPPTRRLREPVDRSCAYKNSMCTCRKLSGVGTCGGNKHSAANTHRQASTSATTQVQKPDRHQLVRVPVLKVIDDRSQNEQSPWTRTSRAQSLRANT